MAKVTSALMGTTRGSVGNVTLRHTGGQTIASQKVTSVKNPRSWAQSEQRMRMAAATTFYSPLSDVLAKAWQDKSRTQSMGEFTRSAIATMAAGGYGFVKTWPTLRPYPFQISKGSLPSVYESAVYDDWDGLSMASFTSYDLNVIASVEAGDGYTVGSAYRDFCAALGVSYGQLQLTFVMITADTDASGAMVFGVRYDRVILSNADSMPLSQRMPAFATATGWLPGEQITFYPSANVQGSTAKACAAFAVIVSGYDGKKWVRSTEFMAVAPYWIDLLQASYQVGVESFMDAAASGTAYGDVYLDGEGTSQGREDASVTFDNIPLTSGGTANVVGFKWDAIQIGGDSEVVAAAVTDQGQTLPISGGGRMATFKKLLSETTSNWFIPDETAFSALTCVIPDSDTATTFAFWEWVSRQSGISLYKVIYG